MGRVTEDTLRRLAAHRDDGGVLSLYVDLDPSTFGTPEARDSEITSLLNEAERAMAGREASHDGKEAMRATVERVRAILADPTGEPLRGARGLAVFCARGDVIDIVPLERRTERRVVFDDAPFVEPLVEAVTPDGWVVLLVNRRVARIMRGSFQRLEQIDEFQDEVHRQHEQGGWSQARYQRSVEQDVRNHLKRTSDALHALHRRRPFDHLAVATPVELWPEVEASLHPDLRRLVAERITLDVEHSTVADVAAELEQAALRFERARERDLLERLVADRETNGRGALGPSEVFAALNERRVGVLLFREGDPVPGAVCPSCGWLSSEAGSCPADDRRLVARDDVTDDAIKSALAQSAEVRPIRNGGDADVQTIAALLRF